MIILGCRPAFLAQLGFGLVSPIRADQVEHWESVLRSVSDSRLGNLPRWLFVSSLFHALLIVFPYLGKTSGMERAVAAADPIRRPALQATLNRLAKVAKDAAVTAEMQQPAFVQGSRESTLSAGGDDEVLPEMVPRDGVNLRPFPGADYYPTNELTAKPQPLGVPALDPVEIIAIAASGTIVLVLRIDENGAVVDTSVEQSDLPEAFSRAATQAFRNLRFLPGELNGQKVGAVMRVEVRYDDGRLPAP